MRSMSAKNLLNWAQCSVCGKDFRRTSPSSVTCSLDCRAANLARQVRVCVVCSEQYVPRGFNQVYCGDECRRNRPRSEKVRVRARPQDSPARMCTKCKASFQGKNPWCSQCVREKKYGMSRDEFSALADAQGGKCAICRVRTPTAVDHCHVTGRVRGLLCTSCNTALGRFGDNVEGVLNVLSYLLTADELLVEGVSRG